MCQIRKEYTHITFRHLEIVFDAFQNNRQHKIKFKLKIFDCGTMSFLTDTLNEVSIENKV